MLQQADANYLYVKSVPPSRFKAGSEYRYQLVVRSRKGGIKYKLQDGPDKMSLSTDGLLTWEVPADFAGDEADVIVAVSDETGQEIFHTFTAMSSQRAVADKGGERPRPAGPASRGRQPPASRGRQPPDPYPGADAARLAYEQVDIKPAPLKNDREELVTPSAIGDLCVGGGGRFLILYLPKDRKLAIFDANEAKIVKYLPLPEDDAVLAAGLDKLIVALPASNILQRWNLKTFEREAMAPAPIKDKIGNVVMGSASRGPLLLCTVDGEREAQRHGSAARSHDLQAPRPEMDGGWRAWLHCRVGTSVRRRQVDQHAHQPRQRNPFRSFDFAEWQPGQGTGHAQHLQ